MLIGAFVLMQDILIKATSYGLFIPENKFLKDNG